MKALAGLFVALLTSCDPFSELSELVQNPNPSTCGDEIAAVEGTWTLVGAGSRTGCRDEVLNADELELRSQPIVIRQNGTTLTLANPSNLPDFRLLEGTVTGSCVRFITSESDDFGVQDFSWTGEVSANRITGTFEGMGPSDCRAAGTFEILIDG
ncbi:MAG: hypothetical protein ACFB9M_11115 [Myxococcota bacterium]